VLVRLEEREREIAAQAEATREQNTQPTARLDELRRAAEEARITRTRRPARRSCTGPHNQFESYDGSRPFWPIAS